MGGRAACPLTSHSIRRPALFDKRFSAFPLAVIFPGVSFLCFTDPDKFARCGHLHADSTCKMGPIHVPGGWMQFLRTQALGVFQSGKVRICGHF